MRPYMITLLGVVVLVFVWSAIGPYDRTTWWLEVFPVLLGLPIVLLTRRRFTLTRLAYELLTIHAIILMVGGHYTYARVPLGEWVADWLDLGRNHYDRLGHFAQGFIPAVIFREVLIRTSPLRASRWLFVVVVALCVLLSACYEFIEWWSALIGGEDAEAFLGTQGDVWDTQWDIFLAFVGSIVSQLALHRIHDRLLARYGSPRRTPTLGDVSGRRE